MIEIDAAPAGMSQIKSHVDQTWGQVHLRGLLALRWHGYIRWLQPTVWLARSQEAESVLLGDPKSADQISILRQTPADKLGIRDQDNFAMHIPRRSSETSVVDVIGRWPGDENYAPIVRQGNCIMVGVTFPATMWTPAYAKFFRNLCVALHDRKREEFSTARRELTKPGTYNFKLAKGGSTEELYDKKFFFQFSEATKITARLEHQGSSAVMLMFRGEDGAHPTRKDGGPTLELTVDISREDIQNLGDRHWALWVTNFDRGAPVDCKLTIECEKP